ncbi:Condensin-2 complex subunit H2 [Camellia lanceoleosa]|uniref:Condensin-2 complex subunit H2 n=1 Tax=Camellia lanceoleosa TaxID=1840588 RepID=A0ACC0G032_9ERIC|nr:Condensin-2 complex subunit H2 [Camellia lanceoleosa]
MDDRYSEPGDLDDEDDPWKPLNPYEPRRQGINSTKRISITIQFPLARMHGRETCKSFCDPNDDNDYDNGGFDFGPSDFDMPENAYKYEEVPLQPEKHDDGGICFETNEHEDPSSQASLEDLSRSHLVRLDFSNM